MIDTIFPEKMKSARARKGLTLEQLATLTGLTASFLSDIESGRRIGSIRSLVKISKALGLSLDDIYGV